MSRRPASTQAPAAPFPRFPIACLPGPASCCCRRQPHSLPPMRPASTRRLALCSEEISQHRLNKMRGVTNHDRIDEELYQDYETEGAKQVLCLWQVGEMVWHVESQSDRAPSWQCINRVVWCRSGWPRRQRRWSGWRSRQPRWALPFWWWWFVFCSGGGGAGSRHWLCLLHVMTMHASELCFLARQQLAAVGQGCAVDEGPCAALLRGGV